MQLEVFAAHSHVDKRYLNNKNVVVLDTLRMTSTIITALANGCHQVIPVEDLERAMQMKEAMLFNNAILGGDLNSEPLPGFDLGNSPYEYERGTVQGTTLIMACTNGSATILKAVNAKRLVMAGVVNSQAVANWLYNLGEDAILLCSGMDGRFSMDDVLSTGSIIYKLLRKTSDVELDDLGKVGLDYYEKNQKNLKESLKGSFHYERLVSLGCEKDIDYCLSEDLYDIVPEYLDGGILIED